MPEAVQLCVGLENKPGMFAKLCGTLKQAGIHIQAIFVSQDDQFCWVNLAASPPESAERVLRDAGYKLFSERILSLRLTDDAASFERVASRLADAGININYVYGSASEAGAFQLLLNVSDPVRAEKLLSNP